MKDTILIAINLLCIIGLLIVYLFKVSECEELKTKNSELIREINLINPIDSVIVSVKSRDGIYDTLILTNYKYYKLNLVGRNH